MFVFSVCFIVVFWSKQLSEVKQIHNMFWLIQTYIYLFYFILGGLKKVSAKNFTQT